MNDPGDIIWLLGDYIEYCTITNYDIPIGVATAGAGAAVVESVVEGTQLQEIESQHTSVQPEIKPQGPRQDNNWWQNIINLFK